MYKESKNYLSVAVTALVVAILARIVGSHAQILWRPLTDSTLAGALISSAGYKSISSTQASASWTSVQSLERAIGCS